MEREKIKGCPFCGGEASLTIPSEHVQADCADIYVSCDECEAEGQHFVVEMQDRTPDLWPYEQRDAIAAWNTRAPADCKLADGDGRDCVLLEDHEGGCLSYDPKEVGVRLMSALGHVENCRAHGRVTDAGFAAIRSALLIADRELSRLRAPADLRSPLEAETCCICSGKSFVAVDVRQFDGTYAPGPERRCVECKTAFTAQAFAALAPTKRDVS